MEMENIDNHILSDISKLQSNLFQEGFQEFNSDIFENIQRKFTELNWFPLGTTRDRFSNNRVSFQIEKFKKKYKDNKILDTLFLTSFGVFGIYLFYKMMEKTKSIPM